MLYKQWNSSVDKKVYCFRDLKKKKKKSTLIYAV